MVEMVRHSRYCEGRPVTNETLHGVLGLVFGAAGCVTELLVTRPLRRARGH
jgi:hypothetical protein